MSAERFETPPSLLENEFFLQFSAADRDELFNHGQLLQFSPGEMILEAGKQNSTLFFLNTGVLSVIRNGTEDLQEVEITKLNPNAVFGEMSVLRGVAVSATIIAHTSANIFAICVDQIRNEKLIQAIKIGLGGLLVDRLEKTNQDVQLRNERELKLLEIQNSAARFLVSNFIVLSVYIISLPLAELLAKIAPTDSFVSLFFITTFVTVAIFFLRGEKGRFNEYGIRSAQWLDQIKIGAIWSIPPILIYIVCKWVYLYLHPSQGSLFDFSASVAPDKNRLLIVTALCAMYFIFSFAQEIVRCVVQKATEIYQRRSSKHAALIALFVANIMFASTHAHLGAIFPLIAFIAGLYWGSLYISRGSYLSCSICHGLMGSVAIFIVGVPY